MKGRFSLLADHLAVPFGPGQRVVVSADTEIVGAGEAWQWRGRIGVDEGLIELRGGEAPSLPDDVVVVDARTAPVRVRGKAGTVPGKEPSSRTSQAQADPKAKTGTGTKAKAAPGGPAEPKTQLGLGADLVLDLGQKLQVRGSGVDARLAGSLTVRGTLPGAPRVTGTVTVRDGSYSAYGQKLEITRGRVVFNGPIDNPVIDLVAMRRGPAVEAGVAVTGTALSPRIRLVSKPDVPDAQKLSWLVLGVGLDDVRSGGQSAALQAAAATLFAGKDGGPGGGLAKALGLDVLTVRSASSSGFDANFGATFPGQAAVGGATTTGATQEVVAIGKRLGSRLMVTYEQGLRGVWSLLRLQYDLTRRLSLRAQTGTDTAIDLLYSLSFD
jgi:translocation and assembly module TamB